MANHFIDRTHKNALLPMEMDTEPPRVVLHLPTVDGQNPAPAKTPRNESIPLEITTNNGFPWFLRWCRIVSTVSATLRFPEHTSIEAMPGSRPKPPESQALFGNFRWLVGAVVVLLLAGHRNSWGPTRFGRLVFEDTWSLHDPVKMGQ